MITAIVILLIVLVLANPGARAILGSLIKTALWLSFWLVVAAIFIGAVALTFS